MRNQGKLVSETLLDLQLLLLNDAATEASNCTLLSFCLSVTNYRFKVWVENTQMYKLTHTRGVRKTRKRVE